jgi:hypothetical protein
MHSSAAGGSRASIRDFARAVACVDRTDGDCVSALARLDSESVPQVVVTVAAVVVASGLFNLVSAIHTTAGARRSHSSRAPSAARAPTVVSTHRSRRVSARRTAGSVTSYAMGGGGGGNDVGDGGGSAGEWDGTTRRGVAAFVARAAADAATLVLCAAFTAAAEASVENDEDDGGGDSDSGGNKRSGADDDARYSGDDNGTEDGDEADSDNAEGKGDRYERGCDTVSSTLVGRTMHHVDAHNSPLGREEADEADDKGNEDECNGCFESGYGDKNKPAAAQRSNSARGRMREASE